METNDFICPACRGHLRPSNKIILSAKNHKGKVGLILLSPELGEYSVVHNESFEMVEGEHIDIFCPVCHADLGSLHEDKNLAKVNMIDEENVEYDILFSEVVGRKCTYKVHGDIVEAFGADANIHTNFWGETPRY